MPFLLSFGAIPLVFAFNSFLFLLPLLFLVLVFYAARAWCGREVARWAVFFGLLFLASPRETAHTSLGLLDLFAVGLPTSFLALALLAALVGLLEQQRRSYSTLKVIGLGILIAALVLTHILLSLFAFWFLALFFLFRERAPRKEIFSAVLLGLILSAWWWIPFLQSLPYSNGISLGLPGSLPDPLFALFPGIIDRRVIESLSLRPKFFLVGVGDASFVMSLPRILLEFPYQGILFLICTAAGLLHSVRHRQYFLPAVYLASLLLLPRNLLSEVTRFGLHTYRFTQPVFLLQIFLSALGAYAIFESFRQRAESRVSRIGGRVSLAAMFGGLVIVCFYQFSLQPQGTSLKNPMFERPIRDLTYRLHLDTYGDAAHAARVMEFLKTHPPAGRIAVDTGEPIFRSLGSAHFFSSQIPLLLDLPVIPGLLAESALSASFLNPTMFGLTDVRGWSEYMLWGRADLVGLEPFRSSGVENMLRRLRLYGIEYIVTGLQASTMALAKSAQVVLDFHSGIYSVFRLRNAPGLVETSASQPMLFISRGGIEFKEFAELWYSDVRLLDCPVLHSVRNKSEIPARDAEKFGGYIVSWSVSNPPTQDDYDEWAKLNKPVIFLNASSLDLEAHSNNINFVSDFGPWSGLRHFSRIFLTASTCSSWTPAAKFKASPRRLEFSSDNLTLINFSFHPNWQSLNSEQEVYWASPSMMAVFGEGAEILEFD